MTVISIRKHAFFPVLLVFASLTMTLLAGCAHKGPILTDLLYEEPQKPVSETGRTAIGVSPFIDERGKTDSLVGRRFSSMDDEVNDLVVQGTVSEKVTAALKSSLKSHGIPVKNSTGWDLTEAGIPANGTKLIIGGEIRTLWVEALSSFASTKMTARVELRILVADAEQRKIVRTLNVSSMIERQGMTFSRGFARHTLSEALTAALDQMFKDDELKRYL
jgi:hypothetical protein